MKELTRYTTEFSDEMISFLLNYGIEYRIIYHDRNKTIEFYSDLPSDQFPNVNRIFATVRLPKFEKDEYEKAKWFRVFGKNDIVPWGKRWYTVEDNIWHQKSEFICSNRIKWGGCSIVTLEAFREFMLCNDVVRDDLMNKCKDITFKTVVDKNGMAINGIYQLSFEHLITLDAFEIKDQSKGEDREASIFNYSNGIVVHLRPGRIYIPTIKQHYLDGYEAVTTDSMWSHGGVALPFCFVSRKTYEKIKMTYYYNDLAFWPIKCV